MKRFYKLGVSVLLLAALALPVQGCAASKAVSGPESTAEPPSEKMEESTAHTGESASLAAEHLLVVWSDYLQVLDHLYESEVWALDYAETYLNSGDWKDLTRARTACIASVRYFTELTMTEEDLTEQEYLALADSGVDTAYQSIEFQSVPDVLDGAHQAIRDRLLEGLESEIFYENSVEILKQEVSVQKEDILCMSRYACCMTNYLLLSLDDVIKTETYWSSMEESFPTLYAGASEWLGNEDDLKAAADAILDDYEEISLKQADIISSMQADLYDMTQIVQNKDVEKLMTSVHRMTNVPKLLPLPEWYHPQSTGYLSFVIAEDGTITYPQSGDELGDQSYGMYIEMKDVSAEDIDTYMAYVENIADSAWKEADENVWYISMPDYNVKIDWKDGVVTILFHGEDVTFAPMWYLDL